jgi:ankyrin repeat protein
MTASNYGHLKVVQALIRAGAEVDCTQDRSDETPLMVASSLGHLQITQELLHAGADRSLKNKNGQTALDLAREHGHLEVVDLLRNTLKQPNCLKRLLNEDRLLGIDD